MKLKNCKIVGFFSMPSAGMAEHNPAAFASAMAQMPQNAGSCSHCGNGIIHHVVIEDENGNRRFIGSECALKVGLDSESVRYRMTTEQIAERNAKREREREQWQNEQKQKQDAHRANIENRRLQVGHVVDMLRGLGGEFYKSLADQLEVRPLSFRQAEYVAKATSSTGRRNKKNAAAFDSIIDLCTK